ncbi:hypothetical protein Ga0100231_001775 [Opitutaceae bacterium TAV4]|nr:hypothetical protein Ga0100231_001775 [Opitutaceae bacterium TAV4]RRJ99254.1 hypothetical protein Ga0100230_013660 [Opitutaceae bacterium TAV3]
MTTPRRTILACLLITAIVPAVTDGGVEKTTFNGWSDAYRISNDTVELLIVPAVGRIMRYAQIDGTNLLWLHPRHSIHASAPRPDGAWSNIGGDKIWPWPDDHWPATDDGQPHPPSEWEQTAHELHITGPRSVRMTSPVWISHGLRVVRDISLDETGTRVVLSSYFTAPPPLTFRNPHSIVPWSVTQMPLPQAILVRHAPTPGHARPYGSHGSSWDTLLQPDQTTLWLPSPGGGTSKIGVASRSLGWWRGNTLFIQRLLTPDPPPPAAWPPHEQAQVFWTENPGEGSPPYVEIEFTAPPTLQANSGASATLIVTWEIHTLSSPRPRMDEVMAQFQRLTIDSRQRARPGKPASDGILPTPLQVFQK